LKYILENTNCKIEVADTDKFEIKGVGVDEKKEEKIQQTIEQSKEFDKMFSLPEDEFS
jgi:hypothetical protein